MMFSVTTLILLLLVWATLVLWNPLKFSAHTKSLDSNQCEKYGLSSGK